MDHKFKRIIIFKGKMLGILFAISMLTFFIITTSVSAGEPPMPMDISGYVLMSDGITQAPLGTHFNITDITSGFFIGGVTDGPSGYSGYYSAVIQGNYGDEIIINAWNATHYNKTTIIFERDMGKINVILNLEWKNEWIGEDSEGGSAVTTAELQDAIHHWLKDIPVRGHIMSTADLQEIIAVWLLG